MKTCRIVVLNYNRKDLLERFLPSVIRSAKASRYPCRVTVLDNASTDGSAAFVRQTFPDVDLFQASANKVLCSYNEIAEQCKEDVLIFLNNDIETEAGFVDPLLEAFETAQEIFFVATHGDCSIPVMSWGMLAPSLSDPEVKNRIQIPGLCFSAGIGAFDRRKFLEIGGYDELYLPGYYEDVDLCFRAWKRGWKGLYAPASRKSHLGGASFKEKYGNAFIQKIAFRNGILFTVKNISDPGLTVCFILMLLCRLLTAWLSGKGYLYQGLWEAILRFPVAWKSRSKTRSSSKISDREVLQMFQTSSPSRPSIRFMRSAVNHSLRNPIGRFLFSVLGFLTVRLIYPLQYLILRDLSSMDSVLDLGCGSHSMVPILPVSIDKTGVELFEPSYKTALQSGRHNRYLHEDLTKVSFEAKSFDGTVMLDVLEHLSEEEGSALLEKMEKWARRRVVIFTPNGFHHQDCFDNNPLMEHKSGWTVQDFKKRGYRVYGVRGFKFMKKDHGHDATVETWQDRLVDLTQLITYHFPSTAFQLYCVKEIQ